MLRQLLGVPGKDGHIDSALVAQTANDFAGLSISEVYTEVDLITKATNPQALAGLATVCVVGGYRMIALTYISLHTIRSMFSTDANEFANNQRAFGYRSFTRFVEDWVGPNIPVSRTSVFQKMTDIDSWLDVGCNWTLIRDLLTNTPMAGREAIELIVEPAQDTTIVDTETGEIIENQLEVDGRSMPEYFEDLTRMGPGEARRDVRDKAGIPERYVKDAAYVEGTSTLLIHGVWGTDDIDVVVTKVEKEVARWLCSILGVRMETR